MRVFLFLFGSILFCFTLQGQQFLVVQKLTSPKQVKYAPGDELGVEVEGDNFVLYGELIAIDDSSVVIEDQRVQISKIKCVYDRRRVRAARAGVISTAAAVPFFLIITSLDNWINTGDRPLVDNNAWRLSAIFGGVSLGLLAIPPKKYRIGKRWKVMSLNTRFGP